MFSSGDRLSVVHVFVLPYPRHSMPGEGQLGPDPEPLGTERFERLLERDTRRRTRAVTTGRSTPPTIVARRRRPDDHAGRHRHADVPATAGARRR